MTRRKLYVDYETFLIVPAMQAPPIVCMSYCWDDGPRCLTHIRPGYAPRVHHYEDLGVAVILYDALSDPNVEICAYNATFEAVVTMANFPSMKGLVWQKFAEGKWHCPMVREKLIRVARGDRNEVTGLDDSLEEADIEIELDKSNPWRVRFGTLLDVPVAQWDPSAREYSLGDLSVRELEQEQLRSSRPSEYIDFADQMQAALSLQLTTCRGIMTDLEASEQLLAETIVRIEAHKGNLIAAGLARWEKKKGAMVVVKTQAAAAELVVKAYEKLGLEVPRNDPTPSQFKKLFEKLGLEFPEMRAKKLSRDQIENFSQEAFRAGADWADIEGNICLNEEACNESRNDLLVGYSEFGRASTMLGKVKRLVRAAKAGKPIQGSYNVIVATGRTSARQGKDPEPGQPYMSYGYQVQNINRSGEEIT